MLPILGVGVKQSRGGVVLCVQCLVVSSYPAVKVRQRSAHTPYACTLQDY